MPRPQFHVYIALSADGYIARADGAIDWLAPFDSEEYGYDDFTAELGAIVMGRTTFDQLLGFGEWPYQTLKTYVMTSSPPGELPEGVEAVSESPTALAEKLSGTAPQNIWVVGGGALIQSFLKEGLIDRMDLFVMPLMLGSGIRLFGADGPAQELSLKDSKTYENGAVMLRYET